MAQVIVPVRYAAWLSGDLGEKVGDSFSFHVGDHVAIHRTHGGFVVTSDLYSEAALVGEVLSAVEMTEREVESKFPVFYSEMGTVFANHLKVSIQGHA